MNDGDWRGKVGSMDHEEVSNFLAEPQIARVACLTDDGWPYIVPCWQEWDGQSFWVVPRKKSAWARYLANDSRCAVTVDEAAGQRKISAQCRACLVEEPNLDGEWIAIARRMSERYLGENGSLYLEPTMDRPRWLFRLEPINFKTWQGVEWANKYK